MLTVVCWKWTPPPRYRSTFGPETVNTLRRMVARHYPHPHELVCVTDNAKGIDKDVRIVPLWSDFANVPNPNGGHNPSCYRRLKAFSPEARQFFGERFVSVDLDCVITGDLTPLWNRTEDFIIWGETNPRSWFNGSMWMMTAGARAKVWANFNPKTSPREAKKAGRFGSDQGWISHCLGPREATWTKKDGVYSYRVHVQPKGRLPENARIVFFHGKHDPWAWQCQRVPWIQEHYR